MHVFEKILSVSQDLPNAHFDRFCKFPPCDGTVYLTLVAIALCQLHRVLFVAV